MKDKTNGKHSEQMEIIVPKIFNRRQSDRKQVHSVSLFVIVLISVIVSATITFLVVLSFFQTGGIP